MYEDYFHLRQCPFDHTPDPRFLVGTRRHSEALATLYYGVRKHKGIVALTGEVGTGKTLLLRCLLNLIADSSDISCIYLFTPPLKREDFLQALLLNLGLPVTNRSVPEMQHDLYSFLLTQREHQHTTALIIDEAQLLSHEVLEEVRLLSNYETNNDKLLQIVLSGQPEFDDLLDSTELRQLKQRIALRARLEALTLDETRQYVAARLQTARDQMDDALVFPEETIAALYWHSHGLPRIINTLCENSLISTYASQLHCVSPETIAGVAKDFRFDGELTSSKIPTITANRNLMRSDTVNFGTYSGRLRQVVPEGEFAVADSLQRIQDEPGI